MPGLIKNLVIETTSLIPSMISLYLRQVKLRHYRLPDARDAEARRLAVEEQAPPATPARVVERGEAPAVRGVVGFAVGEQQPREDETLAGPESANGVLGSHPRTAPRRRGGRRARQGSLRAGRRGGRARR